ncbi:MAG TPA: hypothetical protein VFS40_00180 [Gemmatimonadales bacterium]|nr:hypothetical protein [Gemmatimonadales bacterium]
MRETRGGAARRTAWLAGLLAAATLLGCPQTSRDRQNATQTGGTNTPLEGRVAQDSAIPAPHGAPVNDSADTLRGPAAKQPGGAAGTRAPQDTTRR